MILCHKCSGVLVADSDESQEGLNGCICMSGWVRGFEPVVSREEALAEQTAKMLADVEFQARQEAQAKAPRDWRLIFPSLLKNLPYVGLTTEQMQTEVNRLAVCYSQRVAASPKTGMLQFVISGR